MVRREHESRFDLADALAVAAGATLGVALGFVFGGSVGRVNSRRIQGAVRRWKDRRGRDRLWRVEDSEMLEARVLDALHADVVLAQRPIRVAVLGQGLVELTGRVSSAAEIGAAGDMVQRVRGVRTVLNHLLAGSDAAAVDVPGPDRPRAARG